jgi:hypothetical protein
MTKILTYGSVFDKKDEENDLKKYTAAKEINVSNKWFPVGYNHVITTGKHKTREGHLQSQCRRWLSENGYLVLRAETGLSLQNTGDGMVAKGSPMRGWPDLLVFLPPMGRVLGVELKVLGGRISGEQIARLVALQSVGGLSALVFSLNGLIAAIDEGKPIRFLEKVKGLDLIHPIPIY